MRQRWISLALAVWVAVLPVVVVLATPAVASAALPANATYEYVNSGVIRANDGTIFDGSRAQDSRLLPGGILRDHTFYRQNDPAPCQDSIKVTTKALVNDGASIMGATYSYKDAAAGGNATQGSCTNVGERDIRANLSNPNKLSLSDFQWFDRNTISSLDGRLVFTRNGNQFVQAGQTTCASSLVVAANNIYARYTNRTPDNNGLCKEDASDEFVSNVLAAAKAPDPNNPAPTPGAGATPDDDAVECDSGPGGFNWIICAAIKAAVGAIDFLKDRLIVPLLKVTPLNQTTNPQAFQIWESIRNISAGIFIVVFFMVIFGTAIGFDNYTIKKILPRLVIGAILMPLSWYICGFFIDIGNVLGSGIGTIMAGLITTPPTVDFGSDFNEIIYGAAAIPLLVSGIFALTNITAAVVITVALAFLTLLVTLIYRQIMILFLVILSPIAFMAFVLPNTDKYFKLWWTNLLRLILMYPIIIMLIQVGRLFASIAGSTLVGGTAELAIPLFQMAGLAIPLFAVGFASKWAGQTMSLGSNAIGKASGMLDSRFGKDSNRGKMQAQNRQNTKLLNAQKLSNAARALPPGTWAGRKGLQMASAMAGGGSGVPTFMAGQAGRIAHQQALDNASNTRGAYRGIQDVRNGRAGIAPGDPGHVGVGAQITAAQAGQVKKITSGLGQAAGLNAAVATAGGIGAWSATDQRAERETTRINETKKASENASIAERAGRLRGEDIMAAGYHLKTDAIIDVENATLGAMHGFEQADQEVATQLGISQAEARQRRLSARQAVGTEHSRESTITGIGGTLEAERFEHDNGHIATDTLMAGGGLLERDKMAASRAAITERVAVEGTPGLKVNRKDSLLAARLSAQKRYTSSNAADIQDVTTQRRLEAAAALPGADPSLAPTLENRGIEALDAAQKAAEVAASGTAASVRAYDARGGAAGAAQRGRNIYQKSLMDAQLEKKLAGADILGGVEGEEKAIDKIIAEAPGRPMSRERARAKLLSDAGADRKLQASRTFLADRGGTQGRVEELEQEIGRRMTDNRGLTADQARTQILHEGGESGRILGGDKLSSEITSAIGVTTGEAGAIDSEVERARLAGIPIPTNIADARRQAKERIGRAVAGQEIKAAQDSHAGKQVTAVKNDAIDKDANSDLDRSRHQTLRNRLIATREGAARPANAKVEAIAASVKAVADGTVPSQREYAAEARFKAENSQAETDEITQKTAAGVTEAEDRALREEGLDPSAATDSDRARVRGELVRQVGEAAGSDQGGVVRKKFKDAIGQNKGELEGIKAKHRSNEANAIIEDRNRSRNQRYDQVFAQQKALGKTDSEADTEAKVAQAAMQETTLDEALVEADEKILRGTASTTFNQALMDFKDAHADGFETTSALGAAKGTGTIMGVADAQKAAVVQERAEKLAQDGISGRIEGKKDRIARIKQEHKQNFLVDPTDPASATLPGYSELSDEEAERIDLKDPDSRIAREKALKEAQGEFNADSQSPNMREARVQLMRGAAEAGIDSSTRQEALTQGQLRAQQLAYTSPEKPTASQLLVNAERNEITTAAAKEAQANASAKQSPRSYSDTVKQTQTLMEDKQLAERRDEVARTTLKVYKRNRDGSLATKNRLDSSGAPILGPNGPIEDLIEIEITPATTQPTDDFKFSMTHEAEEAAKNGDFATYLALAESLQQSSSGNEEFLKLQRKVFGTEKGAAGYNDKEDLINAEKARIAKERFGVDLAAIHSESIRKNNKDARPNLFKPTDAAFKDLSEEDTSKLSKDTMPEYMDYIERTPRPGQREVFMENIGKILANKQTAKRMEAPHFKAMREAVFVTTIDPSTGRQVFVNAAGARTIDPNEFQLRPEYQGFGAQSASQETKDALSKIRTTYYNG